MVDEPEKKTISLETPMNAPVPTTGKVLNQDSPGGLRNEFRRLNEQFGTVFLVMAVLVMGLGFTVYAMIQSYIGTQSATYQSLEDKVSDTNNKIDLLNQKLDYYQELQKYAKFTCQYTKTGMTCQP